MKLKSLFLLYLLAPVSAISVTISGFKITLSVASVAIFTMLAFTSFMLSSNKINIREFNIYAKTIFIYYFIYLLMLCFSFFYVTLYVVNDISIKYFMTNLFMNIIFISAFITSVFLSYGDLFKSIRASIEGFFLIALLSSIYGISCMVSLIYFSFDLENMLGQFFTIGSEFEAKRDWAVGGIFRGPGLLGINNSAIFYSCIAPALYYFSFIQKEYQNKKYKLFLFIVTLGCLFTMSRIGIFLFLISLALMFALHKGLMKSFLYLILSIIIFFVLINVFFPQLLNSDFLIEFIEARLNLDSNRFLLYQGGILLIEKYPMGVGLGQYYPLAQSMLTSYLFDVNIHSSWINSYLSLGPIYFVCLFVTLLITLGRLLCGNIFYKSIALGLLNLMVAGLVNQVFENIYFQLYLAICFMMMINYKPNTKPINKDNI